MYRPFSRSAQRLLAFSCALGVLFVPAAIAKQQELTVARNFLPPVALINSSMTLEDLEPKPTQATDEALGPIVFSAVSPATVKLSDRPAAMQSSLHVNQSNEHEMLITLQRAVDERDLKNLWEATVEQNPVIRFSLEKLALPIDLHAKHSSRFLNKTLAAMVNGAAMGMMMTMPAAGAYQNMGLATASQAAQNVILGNNKPQTNPLTATEQIQLAGLIDDLKADLVQNYQSYKKSLEQLAQARAVSLKNNNLYATALKSPNPLARMAAASAYYKAMLNETEVKQKSLIYRLKLERLAGKSAVSNLQLALIVNPLTEIASSSPASTDKPVATTKTSATITTSNTPEQALQSIDALPLAPLSTLKDSPNKENELIGPSLSALPSANNNDTVGPVYENAAPVKSAAYKPPAPLSPVAEPSFDSPPVPTAPNPFHNMRGHY